MHNLANLLTMFRHYYASSSSGDAYSDRQLAPNFEL